MENESPTAELTEERASRDAGAVHGRRLSLALALTIVSLLIWFGFQTTQVVIERNNLGALKANMDGAMQDSQKLQTQLHSLISKTAELASRGMPPPRRWSTSWRKRAFPSKPRLRRRSE